ncbi:Mud2p [Lachancea thermotolerans CBS 6340]|uniref:KLTH0B04312p n=1 Tax=Lachancea thermotolerans (strain ATCC 56472 / CBS 6340 / NRRL Y-8284) TaxID=559295 RepID=C5DCM5_LACTC|nr:KLTH0B04312p [Lachancea thermotolerans CBS 6340]CAR21536.1 KLTH0B04312p [Lachancea thermotolerans CBS 6340]
MSNSREKSRFSAGPAGEYDSRSSYRRDTRGPRRFDRGDMGGTDGGRSRYGGRSSRNFENRSRYQGGGRYRQEPRYGDSRKPEDVDWSAVVSISQRRRMRETQWDMAPKGFEKVPAERAKLSGLFPLPGQPQDLDRSKLEGIVSSGVLTRRTRILFEDPTESNMSKTKYNQILILTSVGSSPAEMNQLAEYVKEFVKLVDETQELKEHKILQENRLYLRFSSEEITTIALSCQKFIERKTGSKFIWQRPGECVEKKEPVDPICAGSVIALQELGDCTEEGLQSDLNQSGVETNWLKLISLGKTNEFTGTALIDPKANVDELSHYKWIRPNDCKLRQDFTEITFQQLPHLVARKDHAESRVIVLLNCVDPMDLKNDEFVKEIRDSMTSSKTMTALGEIESVKIPQPGADYRTSFESIEESVGKIYVKFKEQESAKAAMSQLSGVSFNDRTVLCAYYSERDYNMDVL